MSRGNIFLLFFHFFWHKKASQLLGKMHKADLIWSILNFFLSFFLLLLLLSLLSSLEGPIILSDGCFFFSWFCRVEFFWGGMFVLASTYRQTNAAGYTNKRRSKRRRRKRRRRRRRRVKSHSAVLVSKDPIFILWRFFFLFFSELFVVQFCFLGRGEWKKKVSCFKTIV